MIIGIDGNEANLSLKVGVGQYAFNILWQLHDLQSQNQYIIYLKNPPRLDMPPAKTNWQYRVFGPQKLWTKFALPLKLYTQKEKLDYFYSPGHYSPHFSPFPTIPTIHDLGYLTTPEQFTKKDYHQLVGWTKHSLKKASRIIAVSAFTKNQIIKTYGIDSKKISIVYNGVGDIPKISEKDINKTLDKFKITKPYFLYLGTLKPNKNIPFLIAAFKIFLETANKDFVLVIAGKKGWLFDKIFDTVQKLSLEDKVIFTDYITEIEKWVLYQRAYCYILPSTYEGFGIPILEALKCRIPVIASKIPPIVEVAHDSVLYIDPTNLKSLADRMDEISHAKVKTKYSSPDPEILKNFTWKNSAMSLIRVFEKS
ncbi:MAG TPA: glycosyltransferase family 1 protein [Patescibacteria group bacterium]